MNAKQYLNQVKIAENKIEIVMDQLVEARTQAEKCTSSLNERVQTSHSNGHLDNIIIKIADFERKLNDLIDKQLDLKFEIINVLNHMNTLDYVDIIGRKYLKGESLVEIAYHKHYSYGHIKRLHGEALLEFSRTFDKLYKM